MPVGDVDYIDREFEQVFRNNEVPKELLVIAKKYRPFVKFAVYDELGHKHQSDGEIKLFALKAQTSGELGKVRFVSRKFADIIDANYAARSKAKTYSYFVAINKNLATKEQLESYPTRESVAEHVCSILQEMDYKTSYASDGEIILNRPLKYMDRKRLDKEVGPPLVLSDDTI